METYTILKMKGAPGTSSYECSAHEAPTLPEAIEFAKSIFRHSSGRYSIGVYAHGLKELVMLLGPDKDLDVLLPRIKEIDRKEEN